MTYDVIVVGAGLAGLACANYVADEGLSVVVHEAATEPGGRVGTDVVDGFVCDRGFAVVNPAYPALRRHVDVAALGLGQFGAGVRVRRPQSLVTLAHPVRHPELIGQSLRSGLVTASAMAGVARWVADAVTASPGAADEPLWESLDRAGLTGPPRAVVDQFMAGVLANAQGSDSARFARFLAQMFVVGRPGLPQAGVAALPAQLAAGVPKIQYESPVATVSRSGGQVTVIGPSGAHSARAVVVATGPQAAAQLVPVVPQTMKGLVTWWFATEVEPPAGPWVVVDGREPVRGPVAHAAVVSAAQPSYAPVGQWLVQATQVVGPGAATPVASSREVLAHVGQMFGCDTSSWQVVTRHEVPQALPLLPTTGRVTPGGAASEAAVQCGEGIWACGDYTVHGSFEGALVAGYSAAEAVVEYVRQGRSVESGVATASGSAGGVGAGG